MTWKIERIRAIPVNIPFCSTQVMACGEIEASTRTIIVVETSGGAVGLGEASYAFPAAILEKEFGPAIIGLDALDHALLRRQCLPKHLDFATPGLKARLAAWGGLEIALWDLLGKYANLPLYRLLGGAYRKQAPFVSYSYALGDERSAVSAMVERAREAIAETGAPIFEFKVGVHPPDVEIEMVRAVHDALKGRARVAVDANMGMDFNAARQFLSGAAPYLENCEEPVASLLEMDLLARQFGLSISSHCTDLQALGHAPAIRGVVPTLDVCGGIAAVRQLSEAHAALGRNVWLRSHAESGIGWAAMVHLGISLPNLGRPAQALIEQMADDLVTGDCWAVRDGGVIPPEMPGLGVEPDWPAIERYHAEYLATGELQGFLPDPTNY